MSALPSQSEHWEQDSRKLPVALGQGPQLPLLPRAGGAVGGIHNDGSVYWWPWSQREGRRHEVGLGLWAAPGWRGVRLPPGRQTKAVLWAPGPEAFDRLAAEVFRVGGGLQMRAAPGVAGRTHFLGEGPGRFQPPWTLSFLLREVSTLWIGHYLGPSVPSGRGEKQSHSLGLGDQLCSRTSGEGQLPRGLSAGPWCPLGAATALPHSQLPMEAGGALPTQPGVGERRPPTAGYRLVYLQRR
ncbi:hypothetical protein EI555_013257 [Monodon monoceros]|uniref:Uncharacterized protein n=1 Tax=Monodon monoceros TaxID=40151 RepID=A0A4U1FPH5_MONMO|nr:hypothetical protein EI555_013257 [Monodon monoceros]